MLWAVEVTDEFGAWFQEAPDPVQDDIDRSVGLLEAKGPQLPFPFTSGVARSRHAHSGSCGCNQAESLIVFYAFDPRRTAILLIGGCKAGEDRFYETMIPVADKLYDVHLEELRKEGLLP